MGIYLHWWFHRCFLVACQMTVHFLLNVWSEDYQKCYKYLQLNGYIIIICSLPVHYENRSCLYRLIHNLFEHLSHDWKQFFIFPWLEIFINTSIRTCVGTWTFLLLIFQVLIIIKSISLVQSNTKSFEFAFHILSLKFTFFYQSMWLGFPQFRTSTKGPDFWRRINIIKACQLIPERNDKT